jgi:hypothetical protein
LTSPRLLPDATLTVATVPGIGAPMWRGLPGSILRCGGRLGFWLRSVTRTERGWPLSSKNTVRVPSSCGSLRVT